MNSVQRGLQDSIVRGLLTKLGEAQPARRRGQTVEWDIPGGRAAVHLSFIEHTGDFDTTVDVAIRFDAVEDLVNRSLAFLSPREQQHTFTIGCELGNIERGEPHRLTVLSVHDLQATLAEVLALVQRVALPYVEQFSRLEHAYLVLSRDDRASWIHCPVHAQRAMRACAALIALKRSEELEDLVEKKRAFLASIGDPGLTLFERFLSDVAGV